MSITSDKTFLKYYFFINVIMLFISTFFIFPSQLFDSIYYWTWSKHLALSYLDGPPMIAYIISLTTHFFGNTIASLNLLAFLLLMLSACFIYKIARFFASTEKSFMILALWMFYPFSTIRFLYMSLTLDNVEMLFSLIIVYYACHFIKTQNNKYIYLLGVFAGFGLLAKYNVIFLIIAMLVYFGFKKKLRHIYSEKAVYIGSFLTIILFSPVLLWNYQHHFASFFMQLTMHSYGATPLHGIRGVLFYLTGPILSTFFFWVIVLGYLFAKKKFTVNNQYIQFLFVVSLVIYSIWLPISYFAHIGLNYVVVTNSLMLIVIANILIDHYKKAVPYFLILFSLIDINSIVAGSKILHLQERNSPHVFNNLYCRPESPLNCQKTIHYSTPTKALIITSDVSK